jgi:hypothetical protein
MHSQQSFLAQTVEHLLQSCQIIIFVLVALLAGVWDLGVAQGILWQKGNKSMAVCNPGLGALDNSWHVATDAVGK